MRLFAAAVLLLAAATTHAEGFAGIHLGASRKALDAIQYDKLEEQQQAEMYIVSYRLPNGNVLSVNLDTTQDKVLFMEYDWGGTPGGTPTGLKQLRFGGTNLRHLAEAYGSKGFHFKTLRLFEDKDEVITFNGYPLARHPSGVVVFISKAPLNEARAKVGAVTEEGSPEALAEHFRLDAIVLADSDYLDEIWGEERVYDGVIPAVQW